MTSRTHPTITTLEIYTDEGQVAGENARLPSGSTRYQQVERSIHLGMRILETHDGKASLVKTATDIVRGNQANKKTTLYKGDFHDMPKWIEFFLKTMRSDFPMVYLSHMEGEARAVRQANEIKALKDFSPKHIGYMDVNRYIVNNMIAASQRNDAANLARFQFEMAISIAHEVVHFLTGFLAGEKADTLSTPPDTSVDGYGSKRLGEAGRYWEATLLGGQAQTWQNPKDPAGVLQAGTLYLMDDGMAKSRARLINMAYVNAFVSGTLNFPIRTEGSRDATTRDALRKQTKEMSTARWSAARRAPGTSSPPRVSGAADRRTPRTNASVVSSKGLRKAAR